MKITDSIYNKNELKNKLKNNWDIKDDEYEGRISFFDKNTANHILIQSWDDSYLVMPMVENNSMKGFSAKNSDIGKYESDSLTGAIDHAIYLINKSDKIYN
mgnify:CR=1 FL=1